MFDHDSEGKVLRLDEDESAANGLDWIRSPLGDRQFAVLFGLRPDVPLFMTTYACINGSSGKIARLESQLFELASSGEGFEGLCRALDMSVLPVRKLKDLVRLGLEGRRLLSPPYRVTHLGKPVGVALSPEQFRDMELLLAYPMLGLSHESALAAYPKIMSSGEGPTVHGIAPTFGDGEQAVTAVTQFILKRLTGPRLVPSCIIPKEEDATFVGKLWPRVSLVICPDKIFESLKADQAVMKALPTTPDGAWYRFLKEREAEAAGAVNTGVTLPAPEVGIVPAVPRADVLSAVPGADTCEEERAAVPNRRTKRVPVKPEALLAGLDGDALLEEVLTHPLGRFVCEVDGAVRLSSPLRALVRDGKADPAPVSETPARALRTVNLETAVVHSRLAVMDWHTFLRTVDARRHPAKKWLEMLLGRRLSGHRPDVVDITPDRIGELPGLVAGLHRDDPDRLCAVRVVYRDRFTRRLDKNRTPVVIKTRELPGGRLHRQRFHHVVPVMLAVFPAGWLAPVTEPWMPGLFGTPLDPTLLEFCGTMPEAWRQELAAVIPPEDPVRPMLDVRKLV